MEYFRGKKMNKKLNILVFGILLWLIPFVISLIIFPLREENRTFFESIMPVLITIIVIILSMQYFKNINNKFLFEGASIGIVWFIISILIDLILFLPESEMQMTLTEYFMDIGFTYIIILVIPISFGYLLSKK